MPDLPGSREPGESVGPIVWQWAAPTASLADLRGEATSSGLCLLGLSVGAKHIELTHGGRLPGGYAPW